MLVLSGEVREPIPGAVLWQEVCAGQETPKGVQEVISSLTSVGEGDVCLFCCLLPIHLLTKLFIPIYYFSSKPF